MRAARRRGSSTMTSPKFRSSSAGGMRVVFPAPGGASMTSAGDDRSWLTTAGVISSMGSSSLGNRGRMKSFVGTGILSKAVSNLIIYNRSLTVTALTLLGGGVELYTDQSTYEE